MKPDEDKDKAKPKAATKKPNGKVFDVSRPGKAPAAPTSKPVISGHKDAAQQAQISVSGVGEARPLLSRRKIQIMPTGDIKAVDQKEAEDAPSGEPVKAAQEPHATPEETEALAAAAMDAATTGPPELHQEKAHSTLFNSPKIKIQPLSDTKPEEPAVEAKSEAEPQAAQPEEEKQPEAEPAQEAKEPEPEPDAKAAEEPAAPAEEPVTETKPEPELSDKELPAETSSMPDAEPVTEEAEKEDQPPEPQIEPLFDDSGAIVVSNHEHHRKGHGLKVLGLVLLILVLAAAALNIALDLGLLNLEGLPHTDFL